MNAVESLTKEMFPGVDRRSGDEHGRDRRTATSATAGIPDLRRRRHVRRHGRRALRTAQDERVGVKQYFEGLEFQYRLIKALAQ